MAAFEEALADFERALEPHGIKVKFVARNLVAQLWKDRPEPSLAPMVNLRPIPDWFAAQVVNVDRIDVEIDAAVLSVLALRAPVAVDLRQTLAIKTMATDLERIGDESKRIARMVKAEHSGTVTQDVRQELEAVRSRRRQAAENLRAAASDMQVAAAGERSGRPEEAAAAAARCSASPGCCAATTRCTSWCWPTRATTPARSRPCHPTRDPWQTAMSRNRSDRFPTSATWVCRKTEQGRRQRVQKSARAT